MSAAPKVVILAVDLTPDQAAAIYRLCDKISYSQATATLYSHVPADVLAAQASTMMNAAELIRRMLADQGVNAHPWIETGFAS
ncbi:MAG: hypothetical protein WDM77_09805 [Steroidobacteraceae bacterium]